MKRALLGLAALTLGAASLMGLGRADGVSAAPGTIKVDAGDGEVGYAVNAFLPGTVTVEVGSTVSWQFPWYEPHIIALASRADFGDIEPTAPPSASGATFDGSAVTPANAVYSDIIFGDPANPPTWDVKFTKAGSYDYFCPIHPFMDAKVVVVAAGATGIDTQATADARAKTEYTTAITALKALASSMSAKPVAVTPKAGGGNMYTLAIGGSTQAGNDVMQFIPSSQTIKVGDSIEWVSASPSPHTVTFGDITPPPGPDFDPFALPMSKPTESYAGTGFFNSGILAGTPPGAPADPNQPSTFELSFSKAGTYDYYCILHADQGMVGKVIVEAAQVVTPTPTATTAPATPTATQTTAPRPPSTGTGVDTDSGMPLWLPVLGLVILVAGASSGVFAVRRARQ